MKTTLSIIAPTLCLLSLSACGSSEVSHDATGFFEATEVVVSAEQTGRIQAFPVQQGDIVDVDAPAGVLKYEILDIHK